MCVPAPRAGCHDTPVLSRAHGVNPSQDGKVAELEAHLEYLSQGRRPSSLFRTVAANRAARKLRRTGAVVYLPPLCCRRRRHDVCGVRRG